MSVDLNWLGSQFPELTQIKSLSQGGQKIVFECVHKDFGKSVLKLINPYSKRRVEREIEAVKRIKSEFVPPINLIGTIPTQLGMAIWILEPFIEGLTLRKRIEKGKLDKEQVYLIARDILLAIKSAESVKVVHRDIKPENIIIGNDSKVWLLDFGIARILDLESETRSDSPRGPNTPGYGAPEQIKNRKKAIDSRADLFSLGIVLYECATGKNPFIEGARNKEEILYRVENMNLIPLVLDWDKNNRFSDLVSALVQKYPYQRPKNSSEAIVWLEEIVKG